MARLLTDELPEGFGSDIELDRLAGLAMGHEDSIRDDERAKTLKGLCITSPLKAVGEWLEGKGVLERDEGSGDSYWDFSFILRKHQLDLLKQGKMPNE